MKVTIDIDCSAEEAREFLGLHDVAQLNDFLVSEMQRRMQANLDMLKPEELLKSWMAFGGQATEQFRQLMSAAAGGGMSKS